VAILEGTPRATGLDINLLEEIAAYFREVRKKYARFEGSLRGTDSRILTAQVPGGMLTNLENQLREQNATEKLDAVLEEIPRVREDLGMIPLVTPTSQIVGTQSVINVLTGERYQNITKETAGVLKGEYGATPAPLNAELQAKVLDGAQAITCRPADQIDPELDTLTDELMELADEHNLKLASAQIDDVLTYALFPQVGLKFLRHRGDPSQFEPAPGVEPERPAVEATTAQPGSPEVYSVRVNGKAFTVEVAAGGELSSIEPDAASLAAPVSPADRQDGEPVPAALAGNVFKILVSPGDQVTAGQTLMVVEAMKMETDVSAPRDGQISAVHVSVGDAVAVGDALVTLS
jgi:oxaloacetate decarboxylase alpha subunit